VVKPFGIQELLARVRGLLRQQGDVQVVPEVFDDGHLRVDIAQRQVSLDGAAVRLSRKEFDLLRVLLSYRGRIVTQRQLLTEVWGKGHLEDTHYLRILMARLRTRLADDPASPRYLETEPGVGYRFIL
jgi:two-component system KDP operon response regulator KdpE